MIDVHWKTYPSGNRYLVAGDWSLDPDHGEDTVESLRSDAEALSAAADFLEREEAKRKVRAARDQQDGYQHATRPPGMYLGYTTEAQRKAFVFDEFTKFADEIPSTTFLLQAIRDGRRFATPYFAQPWRDTPADARRDGWAHATGGKPHERDI